MMRQIEITSIESNGYLKEYFEVIDMSNSRVEITCNIITSTFYEIGNYNYTDEDLQKLKSQNHFLYYYYNSIQNKPFSQNIISITKDLCVNAESLDIT